MSAVEESRTYGCTQVVTALLFCLFVHGILEASSEASALLFTWLALQNENSKYCSAQVFLIRVVSQCSLSMSVLRSAAHIP
jgi:hypothetical protein